MLSKKGSVGAFLEYFISKKCSEKEEGKICVLFLFFCGIMCAGTYAPAQVECQRKSAGIPAAFAGEDLQLSLLIR